MGVRVPVTVWDPRSTLVQSVQRFAHMHARKGSHATGMSPCTDYNFQAEHLLSSSHHSPYVRRMTGNRDEERGMREIGVLSGRC